MSLPEPKFKNFSRSRGNPRYGVYLGVTFIGMVIPTTQAPYPGRSQATYRAIPIKSDFRLRDRNGITTVPSRMAGARALVEELRRYAYGRKLLSRVESDYALSQLEAESC